MLDKPTLLRRAALIAAVPVLGGALIGVAQLVAPSPRGVAVNGLTGSVAGDAASGAEASGAPTATPDLALATPSSATPEAITVRGRYVLRGPASAPAGASVQFVLTGPVRVVRTDSTAPFAVTLDTRTVPDGEYRLDVATLRGGQRTPASSVRLMIANGTTPAVSGSSGSGSGSLKTAGAAAGQTGGKTGTTSSPPPGSAARPAATTAGSGTATDFAAQVVSLTNVQRKANGCAPLTISATLTKVALAHSKDMATRNFFDHDNPDGLTPFQRMDAAGYMYRMAAENIAAGQRTPAEVVTAWMNSPGHRANIVNCGLTQIGVGYATGGSYGTYWTQDFGTPR